MYKGVNASEGIGIGTAVVAVTPDLSFEPKKVDNTAAESARYKKALQAFCERTTEQADRMRTSVGEAEAEIIMGHITMAQDPFMLDEIGKKIGAGSCAEQALSEVCDMFSNMFAMSDEELIRQRCTDIEDIRTGILAELLGKHLVDLSQLPSGSVVVVHDLTPSMTASIDKKDIAGIVTETGGRTSHSAIIARALEIPAVLSVESSCTNIKDGDTVIVDGSKGVVEVRPGDEMLADYKRRAEEFAAEKSALEAYRGQETVTADGQKKILACNIGNPDDVPAVLEHDGEAIGLFRSEFLFMDSATLPTEEEQFQAYQKVALAMKGAPVIIRTLDVGGDKEIPYLHMQKEDNPFMGYRAVRYCLGNPDQYKVQLRALLRASAFGDIKIMIPLVTCVEEVRAVKALVEECKRELVEEGVEFDRAIQVGIMVETPSASLIADKLAHEADFFSIGTNDLIGYTMCADRGNDGVAYLYSVYNPSVLRSLKHIIESGEEAGIMVGMCGEAAADPLLVPILIAFGMDEFSVSAPSVLRTRKTISKWTVEEAKEVARQALALDTAAAVKQLLEQEAR